MNDVARDAIFWFVATNGVFWSWRIFRTDNMVRAAYFLLVSFIAVALTLFLLQSDFLGIITILMMVGEMVIMAIYMVLFMQNPGGARPMTMIHQIWVARIGALASFALLAAVIFAVDWPVVPQRVPPDDVALIGAGMMGPKILVFIPAGVALFTTMIAAVAMALKRGRYDRFGERLERRRARHAPLDEPPPDEMTGSRVWEEILR